MPLLRDDPPDYPAPMVVWCQTAATSWDKAQQRAAPPLDPHVLPFVRKMPTPRPRVMGTDYGATTKRIRGLLRDGRWWTAEDLAGTDGLTRKALHNTLNHLVRRGEVMRSTRGRFPRRYALVR